MTNEAQRIAIAESQGWSGPFVDREWLPDCGLNGEDLYGKCVGTDPTNERYEVPDYLVSHDAIYSAIETKWHDVAFRAKYAELLHAECGYVPCGSLHATAAQQAKCYLLALNLWDDSK